MKRSKIAKAMDYLDDDLIAEALEEKKVAGGSRQNKRKKPSRAPAWRRWVAVAAAAVLLFAGIFTARAFTGGTVSGTAVVAFDVNPSLELEINKRERVVSAKALNEDAEKILGDMDLVGADLAVAVNAIVGSMFINGYLSVEQNSILISVDAGSEKREERLQDRVSQEVAELLGNSEVQVSVITQGFDRDKATAKRTLIEKIVAAGIANADGVPYGYEQLMKLNVNDLKLLLEEKGITPDGIHSSGTASANGFIGKENALTVALEKAGVAREDVEKLEIEFDCDDGVMLYEVEFEFGDNEYEYEINAKTGEIVEEEIEESKNNK